MANKEIERKIAVIFATDVVGYSKSVEVNEEQTIKNFRACKKILEDLFKEHDGRIFNTAGDSVLAEFSSAVSAVICATEFQRLMKERNESETTDMKMVVQADPPVRLEIEAKTGCSSGSSSSCVSMVVMFIFQLFQSAGVAQPSNGRENQARRRFAMYWET